MYGISEIKKQNCQDKHEHLASRKGRFVRQANGSVLICHESRTKVLDATDGNKFLTAVRDKSNQWTARYIARFFDEGVDAVLG